MRNQKIPNQMSCGRAFRFRLICLGMLTLWSRLLLAQSIPVTVDVPSNRGPLVIGIGHQSDDGTYFNSLGSPPFTPPNNPVTAQTRLNVIAANLIPTPNLTTKFFLIHADVRPALGSKPTGGTLQVMIVNDQPESTTARAGSGSSPVVTLTISGMPTVSSAGLWMVNSATPSSSPVRQSLPASPSQSITFTGYGVAFLEFNP